MKEGNFWGLFKRCNLLEVFKNDENYSQSLWNSIDSIYVCFVSEPVENCRAGQTRIYIVKPLFKDTAVPLKSDHFRV